MTSARVRRRRQDPDVIPAIAPPTKVGQHISTDTYIVAKSSSDEVKVAHGGEYCVQTHRDTFSGVFLTYPLRQRTTEKIRDSL